MVKGKGKNIALIRKVNDQFADFRGGKKYVKKHSKGKKGAGFGMPMNPDPAFGFSYPEVKRVDTCGYTETAQKLGASSPKLLKGGMKMNPLLEARPDGDGISSYGFAGDKDGLSRYGSYAPVTKYTRKRCGGKKSKKSMKKRSMKKRSMKKRSMKKRNKKRNKKSMKHPNKKMRKSSKKYSRKHIKGGGNLPTNWGDVPNTPGLSMPIAVSPKDSSMANPTTYKRNNVLGTGSCKDNYNHFTGKGFRTPIFDKDISSKNHM